MDSQLPTKFATLVLFQLAGQQAALDQLRVQLSELISRLAGHPSDGLIDSMQKAYEENRQTYLKDFLKLTGLEWPQDGA